MILSEILEELKTALGTCETAQILMFTSRGIEMLANKGVFDSLIGTYEFSTDGQNIVAMPRDVKAVLRVNINRQPSFSRSRIFQYTLNTGGITDGDEIGYDWHDQGGSPIQLSHKLPGPLNYLSSSSADNGKTIKVSGLDENGREITETLLANDTSPTAGSKVFYKVTSVVRAATSADCSLRCNGDITIAQYYGDETVPMYRLIRVSRKTAAVNVMYRRDVFKLRSVSDMIPLTSAMAVVQAAVAAKQLLGGNQEAYKTTIDIAAALIAEEQASRDDSSRISQSLEIQQAVDFRVSAPSCCLAGDVYGDASDIFGPIGRDRVFGKISLAVEALENKGHWDASLGSVSVVGSEGSDLIVLPRFVDSPISVSMSGVPLVPRNKWFEFHVNGGETGPVPSSKWQDAGQIATCAAMPLEDDGKTVRASRLIAIPDLKEDDGAIVTIYGTERLADGREAEVWRDGKAGWQCPCSFTRRDPGDDAPLFVDISKIVRDETTGMVSLIALSTTSKTIAAVGDAGYADISGSPTNRVEALIKAKNPDEVLLLGDVNYETGLAEDIDENVGSHWRRYIYPYKGELPLRSGESDATENHLWPIPGNHDWGNVNPNPDGLDPYLDYFTLPNNGRYYDRVFGDVHVFFLDSEPNEPDGNTVGSVQHQWFAAKVAESTSAWKIVCIHRAPHTSSSSHSSYAAAQWDFAALGIHAVLSGHAHSYERWMEGDLPYFSAGTGSPELYGFTNPPSNSKSRHQVNGAMFIEASPKSIRFRFEDTSGAVLDEYTISAGATVEDVTLGYWYPDETLPRYSAIRTPSKKAPKVRVMYRKRPTALSSMFAPLNIRSKLAVSSMLRSIKASEDGDIAMAESHEGVALKRLREDSIRDQSGGRIGLQFAGQNCPGDAGNIM